MADAELDDPLSQDERPSAEVGIETIIMEAPPPPSAHSLAQRGDIAGLEALAAAGELNVNAYDDQEATPLHWAAINAQLPTCRWLIDHGADVDAIGGELKATPLQWASSGHLYIMHLLLSRGADPNISDAQGFNTLHLTVHSSAVMPVLYMPLAIDERDTEGHTALMWAAYQGDGISVDLLIRHGASVLAHDNAGLTALHWAVSRGSPICIKHLLLAGADLEVKAENGKTPRDMAEELKAEGALNQGLEDAMFDIQGRPMTGRLNERNTTAAVFAAPTICLGLAFETFALFPIYVSLPLVVAIFCGMQLVLLAHKPLGGRVMSSPYFAAIILGSIGWVAYGWATRLLTHTGGYPFLHFAFLLMLVGCCASFYKGLRADPGYVPKYANDGEIKQVIDELVDEGRLNGTNFCIMCMARKPLRSKHCQTCDRCVARYDHHCPWIWNCVGSHNHRYFLLFVMFLIAGIIIYDILTYRYIVQNAPVYEAVTMPALSLCDFSSTLCRASSFDTFQLAIAVWATLQLTWTLILVVTQLWQVARQMTTLEVSNLGRFGFMGGRGGQSLRDQSGAMRQATAVGAGVMPGGSAQDASGGIGPAGPEGNVLAASGHVHGPNCKHGHGHSHSHGPLGMASRVCGTLCKAISGPLLQILGLDRFTRGRAMSGLARAGMDQNPFDLGVVRNCTDFWGERVDWREVYDIPPEGWRSYRRRVATVGGDRGGYAKVQAEEV